MTDAHPRLLLHVGYHKTATTWMQMRLFQPRNGFRLMVEHAAIDRHIVRPHGFDVDVEGLADLVATQRATLQPGEVPVVSSEILSGHPFYGGHGSDVFARHLAQAFPGARILISIRAQGRILPSVYAQYVLRGGTLTAAQFFDGMDEVGFAGFDPKHFEYDRLVRLYQALFGAEAVYILPQEDLKRDIEDASARLAAFAEATAFQGLTEADRRAHTPSYPEYALPVLRRINHVQTSVLNPNPIISLGKTPGGLFRAAGWLSRRAWIGRALGHRRPVTDLVTARFAGRFAESNNRLLEAAYHPLDLTGYDVPKQATLTRHSAPDRLG